MRCQNLPAGHCVSVVKAVLAVSEPTCRALCYSGAGCLSKNKPVLDYSDFCLIILIGK